MIGETTSRTTCSTWSTPQPSRSCSQRCANLDIVNSFFADARATELIGHPNIVEVFDCGIHTAFGAVIIARLPWRLDEPAAEPLVEPLPLVVRNELSHQLFQMALAENHEALQAFFADGSNKTLCARIAVGALGRNSHDLHAAPLEHPCEARRVHRVAVNDKMRGRAQESVFVIEKIPCHLHHPLANRFRDDATDLDRRCSSRA